MLAVLFVVFGGFLAFYYTYKMGGREKSSPSHYVSRDAEKVTENFRIGIQLTDMRPNAVADNGIENPMIGIQATDVRTNAVADNGIENPMIGIQATDARTSTLPPRVMEMLESL